jgi:hypothetical protein
MKVPCGALRLAEGKGLAEGNLFQQPRFRTQSRTDLQNALRRIRQAARRDRKHILILGNDCASLPKAGAQCGRSARWDLSGGTG